MKGLLVLILDVVMLLATAYMLSDLIPWYLAVAWLGWGAMLMKAAYTPIIYYILLKGDQDGNIDN